jgi:hypothetical protein
MQLGLTTVQGSTFLSSTAMHQSDCYSSENSAVRTSQFKGHKIKLTIMMGWIDSMKLICGSTGLDTRWVVQGVCGKQDG